MNRKTYVGVLSLIKEESIGCISTSDKKEFDEISKAVIPYRCFGDVVFSALCGAIVEHVKKWRAANVIDESFDCYDIQCKDKDHMITYRFAEILFPEFFSYCVPIEKFGHERLISSLYHFVSLDDIDKENLSDMFVGDCKQFVIQNLKSVSDSEKVIEMIYNDSIFAPF